MELVDCTHSEDRVKVCHRAIRVFVTTSYISNVTPKCVNCGKPAICIDYTMGSDPGNHLLVEVRNVCFYCDDLKCKAIVMKFSKRTTAFGARKFCVFCRKLEDPGQLFLACSRCKIVHYCSRSCQHSHWKEHKPVCKAASGKSNTK